MSVLLIAVSLLLAFFVGFNIGGSTTAPAFGPSVGASLVTKSVAGALMAVFFALGAVTVGRRVVDTLGSGLLHDAGVFGVESSAVVLGFVGGALYVGNRAGVPASTSMTTVGVIAGLGVASGELDRGTMAEIAFWWLVAPVLGLAVSVAVGAFLYPRIADWIDASRSEGPLFEVAWRGPIPWLAATTRNRDELLAGGTILATGCLMAFSSGTSNVANVVAPLVGAGVLGMNVGVLFGSAAVAVGALTLARRTLETLGNDIVDLPLPAALVVSTVSAGLVVGLSLLGIPASFVVIATVCIAGLGWSRSLRAGTDDAATRADASGAADRGTAVDGGVDRGDGTDDGLEFDPVESARVLTVQHVIPAVAAVGSYAAFTLFPVY